MPDLDTTLHLDMLRESRRRKGRLRRLWRAVRRELGGGGLYGLEWGDPDVAEPLKFVRDRYVLPYVNPEQEAVEIGPGGGRWTRYLLGFKRLWAVDYHAELLEELGKRLRSPRVVLVRNGGTDFPGIPPGAIGYVFSFGTFVHLDPPLIEAYLANLRPCLAPGANVVLQYADKTKIMAQQNRGFSDNTPERMRAMVSQAGYRIVEEDLTTMWHSSIVRFTP
jgi:hypothetical protein